MTRNYTDEFKRDVVAVAKQGAATCQAPGLVEVRLDPSIAVMAGVVGFRNSFSTSIGGR